MADVGRPTVMTAEIIAKLEEAFLNGATDREACFIAQIGQTTLYEYCQENQEFAERKESLKDMVKYKARHNVVKAITAGEIDISQWYLERKVKEEFATRTENTGAGGKDLIPTVSEDDKLLAKQISEQRRITRGNITSEGTSAEPVDREIPNQE